MNNDCWYAVFTAFEQLLINWYFTSTRLLFKCERSYRRNFQTSRMCCSKWHVNLFNCWLNLRRVEVHSTEMKKKKNSAFKSIVHHNLTWYIVKFDKKQKEIHNNPLRIYLQQQHLLTSKQEQQLSTSKQTSKPNLTSISTWPCSYCKLQLSIDK